MDGMHAPTLSVCVWVCVCVCGCRLIAKAEELDHRKVGAKQDLYFFDSNVSPGTHRHTDIQTDRQRMGLSGMAFLSVCVCVWICRLVFLAAHGHADLQQTHRLHEGPQTHTRTGPHTGILSSLPLSLCLSLCVCVCVCGQSEYRLRGFHEVISPNIYSCDLWKTSGHYQNYKENMYTFDVEKQEWGLKPMNCPGWSE